MLKKVFKSKYNLFRYWIRSFILKLILPGRFKVDQVLVITSSPRSGSTLLGQVLNSIPNSCTLFEPLSLTHAPESAKAGFTWRTYRNPNVAWPEGETFLTRVFEGRVINSWTTREITLKRALHSKTLIVKFVRANRLLPWLCTHFNIPSPIVLVRHPCAVIASQIKNGWENQQRPKQPVYLDRYPSFQKALTQTECVEEFLAASWALDLLPVLLQPPPHPWIIITYEELILQPESTIQKIALRWNLKIELNEAKSYLTKPSSVVGRYGINGIDGWQKTLTKEQISRIIKTVNLFGITFYTAELEADYDSLYNMRIHKQIHDAGLEEATT